MSRSWSDTLVLTLMPDRLVLVRVRNFVTRKVLDKETRHCTSRCNVDDWSGLLELCASALSEARWRVRRVRVVVSNHLVRYACVPWMDGLESAIEEEALVRRRLDDIYGAAALSAMELRWDQSGSMRIAGALSRVGLEQIRALCSRNGARLLSVQPLWMAAFNAFRNTVNTSTRAWFVVAEDGLLCLGLLDKKGWHSLRCVRTESAASDLPVILAREKMLMESAQEPGGTEVTYVWSACAWTPARDSVGPRMLPLVCRSMPGFDSRLDSDCAAAMLGVGR